MSFGNQIVYFVSVTEDLNNRDRYGNPARVRTETPVTGCHFRPLTGKEKLEYGDIGIDPWKCTAPPDPAALAATVNSELKVDGVTYQVTLGSRPFQDFNKLFKVTIICERVIS